MTLTAREAFSVLDRNRLADRLSRLVRTPSENPPGNEAEVAGLVEGWCNELGMAVERYEGAANRPSIVARWRMGDGPTVGYCSHIDVVPIGDKTLWAFDPFSAHVEDGRLHGRGSCDAKGPVGAAIEAVAILMELGLEAAGTLELALVADEETMGFLGAGYLVENEIFRPDVAIVGEPTSLRVVKAQRGACWMRLVTRGVASHGSAPERGVNAILHMAEVVGHLTDTLPDISHPVLGGPSINVGTIRGGAKINIVPAGCVAEIDRRTIPGESREEVLASLADAIALARKRYSDLDADIEVLFYGEPFEVAEDSRVVREVSAGVGEALGRPAELMGFRGASDARFIAQLGTEVVVCGPGDIALAHTAGEFVEIEEVERAAVAYALSFARLLQAERQR
jgi:succinyl-diaminopimelate desuccinylase